VNEATLMRWLDEAAEFSEPGPGVTRQFLTNEHRALLDWLAERAGLLGLEYWLDHSGNFRMRKPAASEKAPVLLLGSHQDTVREGGRYDGMLGVLLPLAIMDRLPELPFHLDVVAFGDEEGTRFASTLVGSSALAGDFDRTMLERTDQDGITMAEAFREFGLDPARIGELALDPAQLLGFVEVHIEQGPQLEAHGLPVGTVSAITGIERHQVTVTGKAGHAGTTPMALRDDALVKAAQIVGWVDEACRESRELVGVVGKLTVEPNAVNVIPGRVQLTVELRSPQVSLRREAWRALEERLGALRGVSHEAVYAQAGIDCDAALSERLGRAIADVGVDSLSLFSGAGHDGLAMARVAPCAMLFVRCRDGLSHHPDETVSAADCGVAMAVLERFISTLAGKSGTLDCR